MKTLVLALSLLSILSPLARAQNLAIQGETVYTLSGKPLTNGIVLVDGPKPCSHC